MERRGFIKGSVGCVALCAGVSVLGAFLEGCTSYTYITGKEDESGLHVDDSVFGNSSFVLVKSSKLDKPIYLLKLESGQYRAVYMECTHKQVELKPAGSSLVCPAHGSRFSNNGEVISSPAKAELRKFTTTVNGSMIHISI